MGSINAQRVAHKVLEKVRRNELVNMGQIVADVGYGRTISIVPNKVTNTKSYKKALAMESKPLLERLEKEINEVEFALSQKDKSKEEFRVLVGSLDILIKNYQLLSGGATERQVFVLPSQAMKRYEIEESKPDTSPKDGSTEPLN